jgi:tungstate transport system substrate-binding protein
LRFGKLLLAGVLASLSLLDPAGAQDSSLKVGTPSDAVAALVQSLAPAFRKETGIAVTASRFKTEEGFSASELDSLLVPERIAAGIDTPQGSRTEPVFRTDSVLLGTRGERARVRGLRDIEKAFRWIAGARGTFVSSSPSLGLRALEVSLWDRVGVDVRTRLTWYVEAKGDETDVLNRASQLGAYVLVERPTFAAARDRRGLDVLVADDPILQSTYVSVVLDPKNESARLWQEWLKSPTGTAGIARFHINGVEVFRPLESSTERASG